MDTVLITGISGFLGWNLARRLKSSYRVYGTYLDHAVDMDRCETLAFDLTNLSQIERLCSTIRPKAIVHAAALRDPDRCETERRLALTLNTFATRELARSCSLLESKLIYLSSDLLFDGVKGMYTEAEDPVPMSYYAKTKHLGELEVTNNCGNYVILRLSLTYGRGGGDTESTFEAMERQVTQGKKLNLFTDQYRTPLFVDDAVVAIERIISGKNTKGLFHLGGPERMSRHEFGQQFCQIFHYPASMLIPSRMADSRLPAFRPRDCSLDSRKAVKVLNLQTTSVLRGLQALSRQGP